MCSLASREYFVIGSLSKASLGLDMFCGDGLAGFTAMSCGRLVGCTIGRPSSFRSVAYVSCVRAHGPPCGGTNE